MKRYFIPVAALIVLTACNSSKQTQQSTTKGLVLPAFNKEGHRGTRGLMPENTIAAMQKGIDFDVNTVEVDVVFSKDRQVVISHDIHFNPDITLTPEGKTMTKKEAEDRLLYNMNYDSIKKYDVGLKPYPAFSQQQKIAAYKPLLSELIDATNAYAKAQGKEVMFNIEIKANPAWEPTKQPPVEELVDATMNIVKEKKLENHCYLQSFDFRCMQIINRKYPNMTTAILIGGGEKRSLTKQLEDLGYTPEMYSPSYTLVTKELVDECHAKGMKIIPWTVNTVEEMKKMKALGVDGIITDYPNYFSQL